MFNKIQISKSEYMMFLRHPAWLWLKKHDKNKLPPISDSLQAVFDTGNLFEPFAEKLFPDGIRIGFTNYDSYLTQPERTKEELDNGTKTIFQGRFEHENITCICDVVVKLEDSTVDLYEIKSSTKAKLEHEHDLAFQLAVLESCGYIVRNIKVLCVNNKYVRHGEIDPKELVIEEDITELVKARRNDTKEHIADALQVVASPTIPDISPSLVGLNSMDSWLEIYRFLKPTKPGSIYNLCRLNASLVGKLEERGIKLIADIPEDIELHPKQQLQVRANKENKVLLEKAKIKEFLATFVYPLYFLDYETLTSVVPLFDGLRPYQQVPFQYSLHVIEAPGEEVKHYGYLHKDSTNPVMPLTKSLESQIGDTGTVLVWKQSFEKGRNTEMGCADETCFTFYEQLNERIKDLMIPFSNGWYVDKDFLGSASLKYVLPVLVPELSYKDLNIQEGTTAQRIWMETVLDGKNASEREKILQDLDKYCELDTLAMVRIYLKLCSIGFSKMRL